MSVQVSSRCISVTMNSNCSSRMQSEMLFINPNSPRQDKRVKTTLILAGCSALVTALHLTCRMGGSSLWITWKKCQSCLTQGGGMLEGTSELSAAAVVLALWLASLVQQCELPTPSDQGWPTSSSLVCVFWFVLLKCCLERLNCPWLPLQFVLATTKPCIYYEVLFIFSCFPCLHQ